MKWKIAVAALALAGTCSAAPSHAIELKVADSFPAGHYIVRLLLQPWMEDVTKRTNGAVTFSYFPNQQLGKAEDMLRLAQSGVIDIGYIAPSYASDKMPLSEVAELPGEFATSCEGSLAYWKSARTGLIAQQEYAPNKIRLLFEVALPPYKIFTARKRIESDQDIQGLKLRTTGGAQDLTARALGAVPVRMAAPDAYQSLSRGTLDGLLFPTESIGSYGLTKLVRYATDSVSLASFIVAYSISQASWNHLPPDVQKVIDDTSEAMEPKMCAAVDENLAAARKQLEAAGVSFVPMPDAALKALDGKLKDVGTQWAAKLDRRGKPGSAVLKEFHGLLADADAKN